MKKVITIWSGLAKWIRMVLIILSIVSGAYGWMLVDEEYDNSSYYGWALMQYTEMSRKQMEEAKTKRWVMEKTYKTLAVVGLPLTLFLLTLFYTVMPDKK